MHPLIILSFLASVVAATVNITYSTKGSTVKYPVSINGINLLSATAEQLSQALNDSRVTTLQLVDAYLARLEANDQQGLFRHAPCFAIS